MERIIFGAVGVVALVGGVWCLWRPEAFRWMPVYRVYAAKLGEKPAQWITRLSAGGGATAMGVFLILYGLGVVGPESADVASD